MGSFLFLDRRIIVYKHLPNREAVNDRGTCCPVHYSRRPGKLRRLAGKAVKDLQNNDSKDISRGWAGEGNTELFKQFCDSPSFKKWLSDTYFAATYEGYVA